MEIGSVSLRTQVEIKETYDRLRGTARTLTDLMQTRIRVENRYYADLHARLGDESPGRGTGEFKKMCSSHYRDAVQNADGEYVLDEDGKPMDSPEEGSYELLVKAEKFAGNQLDRQLMATVGPHMQAFLDQPGIGERTVARLFGEIGHPILAFPCHWEEGKEGEDKKVLVADDPFMRRMSDLWSYCGHGDPARKRRAGMEQSDAFALGSPLAKSLVYLLADIAMKNPGGITSTGKVKERSPYRSVYDTKKAHYVENRLEWTPGHRHAAALRVTGKEILRDLYNAALADMVEVLQSDQIAA
jgi:hypothetical protein